MRRVKSRRQSGGAGGSFPSSIHALPKIICLPAILNSGPMKNYQQNIDLRGLDFPQRLRSLRERLHLSQSDLAQRAGLSYRTIHDLELGKRAKAQEKTLLLLAEALGISVSDLVGNDSGTDIAFSAKSGNRKRRLRFPRRTALFAVLLFLNIYRKAREGH